MVWLVYGGAALTAAGLVALVWCIVQAMRARRGDLPEAEFRARMQRLVTVNLAALAVSGLGLTAVVVGVFLA